MAAVTVLDGGMGKELRRIGAPFRQPEWSALAMLEAPHFVKQAHDNFVTAGAEVLTTNVYALVPFHIGPERFETKGAELLRLGGTLAREAADRAERAVKVAGSLPPLFGSYQPEAFDPEAAVDMWSMFVDEQGPYVDFWMCETMSSTEEFMVAHDVLRRRDTRRRAIWASFCLFDQPTDGRARLRSGETVSEMVAAVGSVQPDAVLFNCSQPEMITLAVDELAAAQPKFPFGGYANAFQHKVLDREGYAANSHISERRVDLTVNRYADFAQQWVDGGATIVGGCCDIYPDHIAELVRRFHPA